MTVLEMALGEFVRVESHDGVRYGVRIACAGGVT